MIYVDDLALVILIAVIAIVIFRYGMHVGITTVYKVKTDKPLDRLEHPTEQEDVFEEEQKDEQA